MENFLKNLNFLISSILSTCDHWTGHSVRELFTCHTLVPSCSLTDINLKCHYAIIQDICSCWDYICRLCQTSSWYRAQIYLCFINIIFPAVKTCCCSIVMDMHSSHHKTAAFSLKQKQQTLWKHFSKLQGILFSKNRCQSNNWNTYLIYSKIQQMFGGRMEWIPFRTMKNMTLYFICKEVFTLWLWVYTSPISLQRRKRANVILIKKSVGDFNLWAFKQSEY